jgi:hypothetical protein
MRNVIVKQASLVDHVRAQRQDINFHSLLSATAGQLINELFDTSIRIWQICFVKMKNFQACSFPIYFPPRGKTYGKTPIAERAARALSMPDTRTITTDFVWASAESCRHRTGEIVGVFVAPATSPSKGENVDAASAIRSQSAQHAFSLAFLSGFRE